ncbi:MAG: tetratricopeptide repeat protein [Gemmatimonadota bacterium]
MSRTSLSCGRSSGPVIVHGLVAEIHNHQGRYDLARASALRAVRYAPEEADLWGLLGWLQYANGDEKHAVEAYRKANDLDPSFFTRSLEDQEIWKEIGP